MKIEKIFVSRILVLSYIIAMFVFSNRFSFMSLNIFLAWLPLEFGSLFIRLRKKLRVLFCGLWLLFFPNIPYLLTDLFHLESLHIYQSRGLFQNIPSDWLLFLLLVLPIFSMVLFGLKQAVEVIKQLPEGHKYKWGYLVILAFLSALAIYIGRFDRIHSVNLILHPMSTLSLLLGRWDLAKLQFILLFVFIQLAIWLLIEEIQQSEKEE